MAEINMIDLKIFKPAKTHSSQMNQFFVKTLYCLILTITAVPFFLKHFPSQAIAAVAVYFAILLLVLLVTSEFAMSFATPFWAVGIAILAVLNLLLYPRTRLPGQLSSAPDAVLEPARALFLHGLHPYSVHLFDGAPVSPGPGWIMLNAVLYLSGCLALLVPLYLFLAAALVNRIKKGQALPFVALTLASICFLQMSITGHDLPASALAMAGLTLALHRHYTGDRALLLIAIAAGIVATARVPFIVFPVGLGICLSKIDRSKAIRFIVWSLTVALLIHGTFYLWAWLDGIFYQPIHVFGRASASGSPVWQVCAAVVYGLVVWLVYKRLNDSPASWLYFVWTLIALPTMFIGFGELFRAGVLSANVWMNWEGKGYVLFTLPLLVAGIVLDAKKSVRQV